MKFEACDMERVERKNKVTTLLYDFQKSGLAAAHVTFERGEYTTAESCYRSICAQIGRIGAPVRARFLGGEVCLVSTEQTEGSKE